MKSTPPKCSPDWTPDERIALAAWIADITLDRLRRDDPTMPIVAKQPMHALWHAIHSVLTKPADVLEMNRAALEKPYDSELDRHVVWVETGTGSMHN